MLVPRLLAVVLFLAISASGQTQTTGQIIGRVRDQHDAPIAGASITSRNKNTGEQRTTATDSSGSFSIPLLSSGLYAVSISEPGFNDFIVNDVVVGVGENTSLNILLSVGSITHQVDVHSVEHQLDTDDAARSTSFSAATIATLPISTRNFTQLIGLSPGVTTFLADNTIVGRNTQDFSVNGSRFGQNNIQINGVDASGVASFIFQLTPASPAIEAISDVNVQTSLYDATFGRTAGGSIQAITKSGSNRFSGSVYDYFRDTSLTANNPFLKAADVSRPVLQRNIFGFTLGGPIKKDKLFFFGSYQTTVDRNGASRSNSLSVNVFIDPRLTDDRSDAALQRIIPSSTLNPTAASLLRQRLPGGQYVIPTPQTSNGRYNGSAISRYREEQFTANIDFRISSRNWLSSKFFLSHAPTFLARAGAVNLPGFGIRQKLEQYLLSVQDIHSFSSKITNELRFGYNGVRVDNLPDQPFGNELFGINRPGEAYGFPVIMIDQPRGGAQLGTAALQSSLNWAPTVSLFDTLSIIRGKHSIRFGGEIRVYRSDFTGNVQTRGAITFSNFESFLRGITQRAQIGTGPGERSFRSADHNFFIQDDWRLSSKLNINLGLRYELDPPPYESLGRLAAFDPDLYLPRPLRAGDTVPPGPPIGGFVRADNGPQLNDLSNVPLVSKRILKSIDPNNFAPRLGLAYSPFKRGVLVIRGGYGLFYSRQSFQNAGSNSFAPPFYIQSTTGPRSIENPFFDAGPISSFPKFVVGPLFTGNAIDRDNRTQYLEHFNIGSQFEMTGDTVFEIAYVGTRGHKLYRQVALNQGPLAGAGHPITNPVTGVTYATNSADNAQFRAPYQGMALGTGFLLGQTSAWSAYDSLQITVTRRMSRGLEFHTSYTLARSVDNSSGGAGGSGTTGLLNTFQLSELNAVVPDPFDDRSNRGLSDFDRRHAFTTAVLWRLPQIAETRGIAGRVLNDWHVSAVIIAMSGLPIDIIDPLGGSLYLGANAGGGRPNYAAGATARTAMTNVPSGYYFDPRAFVRAQLSGGQPIPSSGGTFFTDASCTTAAAICTDFGNVNRNALRGPGQFNIDLSVAKRFQIGDQKSIEFRTEIFNLLNNVNFANPISNLNAGPDFGKIISTSNNPRIVQFAARYNF
ncbi:MAG TPA: TonB-dependent receptor [Pyrinomonadaceae bacterium]|nr:TonB-dependent receptor [Pyrinomonadaceae bacterium]